ncbi:MAG: ABC transporter permease, partial [Vicinamibacterales bacterium]
MPFLQDVRVAARMWALRPGLPLLAVISMSLAIAAATSAFVVTDAAVWRPLPLPDAHRVAWISSLDRQVPGDTSPGVFNAWATRAQTISALGGMRAAEGTLIVDEAAERVSGAQATSGLFPALGLHAASGRLLSAEDEAPGAPPVLVISDRLQRTRFAGSLAIGRTVTLDGRPRTIVGVMPPAFDAVPLGLDWVTPLGFNAAQAANVGPRYLEVVARLSTVPKEEVEAELTALARAAGAKGDTGLPLDTRVEPLGSHFAAAPARVLLPLFGAALTLVLIAAVNVAGLMLAHGQRRGGEMTVRASLGASRARLIRQLATEAGVLILVSGALALILAQWLTDALGALLPPALHQVPLHALDGRTVTFALGLIAAATLLAGLLPAFRNSRADLRTSLAGSARTVTPGGERLRRAFVAAQIALAMSLAMAGLLMLQTTRALDDAPRGYEADRVLTAALRFPNRDFQTGPDITRAVDRLVAASRSLNGVERAAIATRLPLSGGAPSSDVALMSEAFSTGVDRQARIRFVTPGFFAAVGTSILEGRDVADADRPGAPLVVLVNDTLARRLAGAASVVGREVKFAVPDFNAGGVTPWRVVGRVADAWDSGPREQPEPEIYVSLAQGPPDVFEWVGRRVLLAVRAKPGLTVGPNDVRAAVAREVPGVPLYDVQTLDQR